MAGTGIYSHIIRDGFMIHLDAWAGDNWTTGESEQVKRVTC